MIFDYVLQQFSGITLIIRYKYIFKDCFDIFSS